MKREIVLPLPRSIMLKTKMSLPGIRPSSVQRDQLLRQLDAGLACKLTVVHAPAGYGKTTLLSQWAHRQATRPAWLSLDEMDNDLIRFWKYALHSLSESCLPGLADRLEPLMKAISHTSILTFLDSLLSELDSANQPVSLLLDDYHVIADEQIHASLSYFIDYLPLHVHLFVASRSAMPFPTSKWTLHGQACQVTLDQLRFTEEETVRFFSLALGLAPGPNQIGQLLASTEGWVAGLQMAAISLAANREDPERLFAGFHGTHRQISEYLLHEVWLRLPSDMQSFLLATCVLPRMDVALCNRMANRSDSGQMLAHLQRQNIFLVPLDDYQTWYRYHHLFGEFLEGRLRQSDPSKWNELHRSASQSFAERELYDEAIDHAMTAADYPFAAMLLEAHYPQLIQRGEFSTLLRWLDRFPRSSDFLSPTLRLLYTFILILSAQTDRAAEEIPALEKACAAMENPEEQQQFASGLFFVKANLVFATGQFEAWIKDAGTFQEKLPENPLFFNFNYNTSEPLIRRSSLGLKGMLSPQTEFVGKAFSDILAAHGWQSSLFHMYVVQALAEGYYEWNRLEDSAALLEQVEPVARRKKTPGLLVPHALTKAKLSLAKGSPREARAVVEEALDTVRVWADDYWTSPLHAFLARIDLAEGRVTEAQERLFALPRDYWEKPALQRELEVLTYVRLLLSQKREEEALLLLPSLKLASKREELLTSQVDIAILQALAKQRLGQTEEALSLLQEALAIGAANGYVRSFLDEGEEMHRLLLAFCQQRQKHPQNQKALATYVNGLLNLFAGKREKGKKDHSSSLVEPLTGKEMIIVAMLSQGASNKRIAEELGNTVGTVKVYLHRIYGKLGVTNRTQALLKAQELSLLEGDSPRW